MIIARPYDHTMSSLLNYQFQNSHTYRLQLCVSSVYNSGNYYLSNVTRTIVTTSGSYSSSGIPLYYMNIDAKYGGALGAVVKHQNTTTQFNVSKTASSAILYDQSASNLLVCHYDFGENILFAAGTPITISWPATTGWFSFNA